MLVYRIEHHCGKGPWTAEDRTARLKDHTGMWEIQEYGFGKTPDLLFRFSSIQHKAVHEIRGFQFFINLQWSIGCLSLDDLGYWFGEDSLLLMLDALGFVLVTYETQASVYQLPERGNAAQSNVATLRPDLYLVEHASSKQAMFDKNKSVVVSRSSVLDIPSIKKLEIDS